MSLELLALNVMQINTFNLLDFTGQIYIISYEICQ